MSELLREVELEEKRPFVYEAGFVCPGRETSMVKIRPDLTGALEKMYRGIPEWASWIKDNPFRFYIENSPEVEGEESADFFGLAMLINLDTVTFVWANIDFLHPPQGFPRTDRQAAAKLRERWITPQNMTRLKKTFVDNYRKLDDKAIARIEKDVLYYNDSDIHISTRTDEMVSPINSLLDELTSTQRVDEKKLPWINRGIFSIGSLTIHLPSKKAFLEMATSKADLGTMAVTRGTLDGSGHTFYHDDDNNFILDLANEELGATSEAIYNFKIGRKRNIVPAYAVVDASSLVREEQADFQKESVYSKNFYSKRNVQYSHRVVQPDELLLVTQTDGLLKHADDQYEIRSRLMDSLSNPNCVSEIEPEYDWIDNPYSISGTSRQIASAKEYRRMRNLTDDDGVVFILRGGNKRINQW